MACQLEDLAEVEDILRASPEAGSWSATSLAETFECHRSHFLVYRHAEGIAGFISGRRVLDEGEILNLAVRPGMRRRGVGTMLVGALLEVFAREVVLQVFLEVRESNWPATDFYKKLGFNQIGKRAGYYQNPSEAALLLAFGTATPASTSGMD